MEKLSKQYLLSWHLAVIVLAGTVVRFTYGYSTKAWLAAPDQLAWGLGIDEMLNAKIISYTQMTHAPHEGGSFFISLVSMVFRPLQVMMPALSFSALLIDAVSRFIQVRITQKIFGNQTAFWFGAWTILSVPLLLPWATVNYGLHSLFSFVPFLFLYIVNRYRTHPHLPVYMAVICGIAISLSYDSVILPVISVLFLLMISKQKLADVLLFFAAFVISIIPHLLTRIFLYHNNPLLTESFLSIRGISAGNVLTMQSLINVAKVWFTSLPGSFLLSATGFLSSWMLCCIVFLFMIAGVWLFVTARISKTNKFISLCMIVLFVLAYALGPFYGKAFNSNSYVYCRHLAFIIPFIAVVMIQGFVQSPKWRSWLLAGWLCLCGYASVQYIYAAKKIDQPAYRAAGWILAKKYGSDTGKLLHIRLTTEPQYQKELTEGFGWGLSATTLAGHHDTVYAEQLLHIIDQFPKQDRAMLIDGIHYSFSEGITPVLDPKLILIIDQKQWK